MRRHISEVELCEHKDWMELSNCPREHKEDFCLLCGYFMEGNRLYMEIHGDNGALNRTKDIDSAQPYCCMECAGQFEARVKGRPLQMFKLTDFIKEKKK